MNKNHDLTTENSAQGTKVLMQLDPPYYHDDQRRAYIRQLQAFDYLRLADSLKNTPFQCCLLQHDCEEIRNLYRANSYDVSWLYNTDSKPPLFF